MRVLLIEDDPMIGKSLALSLREQDMSVDWTQNGLEGEEALSVGGGYALVLLELGLPGKHGLKVLKSLRAAGTAFLSWLSPPAARSTSASPV